MVRKALCLRPLSDSLLCSLKYLFSGVNVADDFRVLEDRHGDLIFSRVFDALLLIPYLDLQVLTKKQGQPPFPC